MELLSSLDDGSHGTQLRIDQCGPQTLSDAISAGFGYRSRCSTTCSRVAPKTSTSWANISRIIAGHGQTAPRSSTLPTPACAALACWVEDDCIRCNVSWLEIRRLGAVRRATRRVETFAGKVKMPSYPVRELHGLVFAYLGEGDPPPSRVLRRWNGVGTSSARRTFGRRTS